MIVICPVLQAGLFPVTQLLPAGSRQSAFLRKGHPPPAISATTSETSANLFERTLHYPGHHRTCGRCYKTCPSWGIREISVSLPASPSPYCFPNTLNLLFEFNGLLPLESNLGGSFPNVFQGKVRFLALEITYDEGQRCDSSFPNINWYFWNTCCRIDLHFILCPSGSVLGKEERDLTWALGSQPPYWKVGSTARVIEADSWSSGPCTPGQRQTRAG